MHDLPNILSGCKFFPVVEGGKLPATANGWKEATDDPAQLAEWHRINPNFNWGVATGLSGLFVIDVDPAGLDYWAKLLERDADIRQAVEAAYQVRTPRGGLHVYFKGEGPSTASRIAEGIDTRGGILRDGEIVSGGYVLLPGSKTDAGTYSALPGGTINPLPKSISAIIPTRQKTDTLGLLKNPDADQPRNVQWATDLLKGYVASGRVAVQGRGGDNLTFQVCASVLDKAISPAMAFDLLWEHWNPHCSPPWDEWELEQKIKNAYEHGEDTASGVKGIQANTDAFAHFEGQEFEPVAARDRARIQPLNDYADNANDPEWLIPNVLPAYGAGMLYGESGSYKSFLALDMALCLAYGIPGQWNAPPVKNDVLFLAGEGPIGMAKKRWPAWLEQHSIEDRIDHRFFVKDRVPIYTDTEGWAGVKEDLALLEAKPALIVIDTTVRLMVGMDENSAKDATAVTKFAEDLAHYYECFVLLIHHTGKDQSKGARGSSAFFSNLDVIISTKKRANGAEFKVRKQKDADVMDETSFFQVKDMSQSIVLERADNPVDDMSKVKSSRHPWASVEEVVRVLESMKGSTSESILIAEIAGMNGIDKDVVRKVLAKSDDLTFLRKEKGKWEIPSREYDL